MKNTNLHSARKAKNDEFYTQYKDIEMELSHYKDHFYGKSIYCNCDDPAHSNFWKYFVDNFYALNLSKVVCTYLGEESYATEYDGIGESSKRLIGDGDFRSPECVEFLREADIVVTNPPFSLFREYIAQLMEHEKKFLVIGNMNAITYKEVFSHIKANHLWLGLEHPKVFVQPDGSTKAFGNINWFTNLDNRKRHEEICLVQSYHENKTAYPMYDNYDAIEVSKVADIPYDYNGVMGVPITFLCKYNPDQFEILHCDEHRRSSLVPEKSHGLVKDKESAINGKPVYVRILIRRR
jgi:hypothetical protein